MQLPERVRVGLYDVRLTVEPEHDERRAGWSLSSEAVITLHGVSEGPLAAELMIHELLHAVAYKAGRGKMERSCTLFAIGACEILRDNPAFTAWLIEALGIGPAVAGLLRWPKPAADAPLPGSEVAAPVDPELAELRQRQIDDLDTPVRMTGGDRLTGPRWNGHGA